MGDDDVMNTNFPKYIILIKKPEDETIYGYIENSFSMDVVPNRTFVYWTSALWNPPKDEKGKWRVDGEEWALGDFERLVSKYPNWYFEIFDITSMPINVSMADGTNVYLNWEVWKDAHTPSNETISGIKNKHEARNIRFTVGSGQFTDKEAKPLKATITNYALKAQVDSALDAV